ncbi:MAG: FtsX-like permease family protein [Candidatus Scalinduaceae bacterium]
MYKLFISLRYLRRKKITFFAVAGVSVGVMTLIVVLSVMSGFDKELRSKIRGTLAHIIVMKRGIYGFDNYEEVINRIKSFEHVEACSPYIEGPALLNVRGAKEFAYFKGVDPIAETKVGDFENYIKQFGNEPRDLLMVHGEKKTPSAFGGTELLRISPGDPETNPESFVKNGEKVVLVAIKGWDRINVKSFIITGKFKSGMYDVDKNYIYIPLKVAQELVGTKDSVTAISVKLDDYKNAPLVRDRLQRDLGIGFYVQTWEDARETFLKAVALERRVMAFILFFIIIVAGFNILAILTMIVFEKSKDIGILKALGATTNGIMSIFLLNGLLIGLFGAAVGTGLGLAFISRINSLERIVYKYSGWRPFPPEVYYFNEIPTDVDVKSIIIIVSVSIACGVLFSIYPASKAARLNPVETLRYE